MRRKAVFLSEDLKKWTKRFHFVTIFRKLVSKRELREGMILVMDIGNTNIEFGVFSEQKGDETILANARYFTRTKESVDELAFFILRFLDFHRIESKNIKKMIFSSVVPQLNQKIIEIARIYFFCDVVEVDHRINLGIVNRYKNPLEVGSDRLVNAAYVYHKYRKNSIIVDLGTATTYCIITEQGEYLGGIISPGIQTAAQALFDRAAKLFPVEIQRKNKIIGDNTEEAIKSGIYFSNLYAMKEIISEIAKEKQFLDYLTVGTGGYVDIFKEDLFFDVIDKTIALKGLKYISDIN